MFCKEACLSHPWTCLCFQCCLSQPQTMKLKLKIFIYGNRVMHDTSCCFDSLSKFIVNGLWMWPTDKSESFEQNQYKLCEVQIDGEDRED